jgi:hypothetical protein
MSSWISADAPDKSALEFGLPEQPRKDRCIDARYDDVTDL